MTTNLVHNAIVHNLPEQRRVWVTTSVLPAGVTLTVENTGEELSPQLVATLAEPFRRGTTARTPTTQASASAWPSSSESPERTTGPSPSPRVRPGDSAPLSGYPSRRGDPTFSFGYDTLIAVTGPAHVRRWKLTFAAREPLGLVRGSWMRRWWWGQSRRPSSTLVRPPWDQGMLWWAWQRPGGTSQPCGGAAAVAHAHGDPHVSVWRRRLRPTSRTWLLAAEDDRDDPGGAGEPAGFGCGDAAAGVQGADPGVVEVGQQLVQGHRHDDGGAAAAGPG